MKEIEEFVRKKYDIEALVGQGAKSKVFKVKKGSAVYALKVSEDVELLKREAFFLKNLSYDTFPRFFDWMESEQAYLIMEYVEGFNLQEIMDKGQVFSLEEALWILEPVLQGLDYLHRQSPYIVYRDLKPANILVGINGQIYLTDFGSAFTETMRDMSKVRTGTYGYAAPEQFWQNMQASPDWDVYAAGKLLGYLLTGKNPTIPPYQVEDFYENDKRVSPFISEVINRCLNKNREARFVNAGELLKALKEAKDTEKKHSFRKRVKVKYKKCVWMSEYRRIF